MYSGTNRNIHRRKKLSCNKPTNAYCLQITCCYEWNSWRLNKNICRSVLVYIETMPIQWTLYLNNDFRSGPKLLFYTYLHDKPTRPHRKGNQPIGCKPKSHTSSSNMWLTFRRFCFFNFLHGFVQPKK